MSEIVLAVRLRALGDVVLVTPALRALARGHADAEIHAVTDPRYAPLLEGAPGVARVWPLERTSAASLRLVGELRRRRVRAAVDFFGNPRSALVASRCGAARVHGYALRGRARAYTHTVPRELRPGPDRREYAAATHVRLAESAGGVADGLDARLPIAPGAFEEAARLFAQVGLGAPERTVGLVAAGTWPTKTWPVSHVAMLARALADAGHPLLLIAGPDEDAVTRRLVALAPAVRVLPACGVAAMVAVIARLRALVGTDSGPRHVAAAFGVPTFSWFGPTHPDTWNPPGDAHGHWRTSLPCRACDLTACPHWNCLPGLDPERASAHVLAHLERHERPVADLGPAARA